MMRSRCMAYILAIGIGLAGHLFIIRPAWSETFVQSTTETRLMLALRVDQGALQKQVPAPWEVTAILSGPLKDANLFVIFIDMLMAQDAQGKPDPDGCNRYVVFAVPAKRAQSRDISTVVIGGYTSNIRALPGAYGNSLQGTIRREQTQTGTNMEAGAIHDFWEVRDPRGGVIDLRVQYQTAIPLRAKSEQKIHSAPNPDFFRIYRLDTATDMPKSIHAGVNKVQNYSLRVTAPEMNKLFDGTEQLVTILAQPLYLRQIFLP